MTIREIYNLHVAKLKKLEGNPKDIKCPGVVRKLRRQKRNFEKKLGK